jgi:hypothetical protein
MKNKIIDQQTKNNSRGKALVSFMSGVSSILISLNPLGLSFSNLFIFPLFTFLTSIPGLILGIMSLKSKPSRRLTTGLAVGGIVFSLIGLILGLLLLPIVLYLGSGP